MPFLSIIVPTFNSGATLENALVSVLSQDFDDYEIWIIDGCSTDETVGIAKRYQLVDNRIYVISEVDKGIYDAMNKGVALARGKWLYFMGSDDRFYDTHVLKTVFNTENNGDYDVLYGSVHSSYYNGFYDGEFTSEKLYNQNICHQAIFIKKNLFQITGNFDIRFKVEADWHHNIKWFLNPRVKKKYIDVIVAEYADGGFSTLYADTRFADIKHDMFLKFGSNDIDKKFRSYLIECSADQMKKKNNLLGYLKFKLMFYLNKYA